MNTAAYNYSGIYSSSLGGSTVPRRRRRWFVKIKYTGFLISLCKSKMAAFVY
jgi:hypothetical protein